MSSENQVAAQPSDNTVTDNVVETNNTPPIQEQIANWKDESLMAVIPGVAISRLWSSMGMINTSFAIMGVFIMVIAFIGLGLMLFMSLDQRKKELSILRIMGARPIQILYLLVLESFLLTGMGAFLGLVFLFGIGIWESEDHIANARPQMISLLDRIRDDLDVISESLGVTDPVSGPVIYQM